jgi:mono/diheme cytochrome c family protein
MRPALFLIAFATWPSSAQDGTAFFETSIQPVLRANCVVCHSEAVRTSGLSLETRESILRGGNRGEIVKPGTPAGILMEAVRQEGSLKMPPGKKLKDEQIAALEKWISMGLPMPEPLTKSKRPGADHWAFQPPKRQPLPEVRDAAWARNPIDRFILAKSEAAGMKASEEADRDRS